MSAEDYDDVPGIGRGGFGSSHRPRSADYSCKYCGKPIKFLQRKALNIDGSPHRCQTASGHSADDKPPEQATLFAMAAMNAIINAQIQAGGVDFIHSMNFHDVADASWRVAAAMVRGAENYQSEPF